MGKLHTLRRAIERDPEKWKDARGADRWKKHGRWLPMRWYRKAYGAFIRSVLRDIEAGRKCRRLVVAATRGSHKRTVNGNADNELG